MSRQWQEVVDDFDAVSEDGQKFHIVVLQTMIDAGHQLRSNPPPRRGLKSARTTDGYACNYVDDEAYEVLAPLGEVRVKRLR